MRRRPRSYAAMLWPPRYPHNSCAISVPGGGFVSSSTPDRYSRVVGEDCCAPSQLRDSASIFHFQVPGPWRDMATSIECCMQCRDCHRPLRLVGPAPIGGTSPFSCHLPLPPSPHYCLPGPAGVTGQGSLDQRVRLLSGLRVRQILTDNAYSTFEDPLRAQWT